MGVEMSRKVMVMGTAVRTQRLFCAKEITKNRREKRESVLKTAVGQSGKASREVNEENGELLKLN